MNKKEKIYILIVMIGFIFGILSIYFNIKSDLKRIKQDQKISFLSHYNIVCYPQYIEGTKIYLCTTADYENLKEALEK